MMGNSFKRGSAFFYLSSMFWHLRLCMPLCAYVLYIVEYWCHPCHFVFVNKHLCQIWSLLFSLVLSSLSIDWTKKGVCRTEDQAVVGSLCPLLTLKNPTSFGKLRDYLVQSIYKIERNKYIPTCWMRPCVSVRACDHSSACNALVLRL